jgi:hypothetical protein
MSKPRRRMSADFEAEAVRVLASPYFDQKTATDIRGQIEESERLNEEHSQLSNALALVANETELEGEGKSVWDRAKAALSI